jgi:hypothetical protein
MKAIKTIQIAIDVRDYRFIRDCAISCIELRKNPQIEINKLTLNKEKSNEQIERLNYLHQVLKPTIKFFNDNFDGHKPKLFEFGELKYFMDCLTKVMQNKISKWEHQIQELEKSQDKADKQYESLFQASIFYAKEQIIQVNVLMTKLKEIFNDDEDNTLLEELTTTQQYKNLDYETSEFKKLK